MKNKSVVLSPGKRGSRESEVPVRDVSDKGGLLGTDSLVGSKTSSTLGRLDVLSLFGRDYPVLSFEDQMDQGHEKGHENKRVQTTVIRSSNEGVNWDDSA